MHTRVRVHTRSRSNTRVLDLYNREIYISDPIIFIFTICQKIGTLKLSSVKNPTESLVFADAGKVRNPTEKDPDLWTEIKGAQLLYFLTPSHPDFAANNPYRVFNRHAGSAMMSWADGHSSATKVSKVGFQYFPGKTAGGDVARGDSIVGVGNDKWDPRWMWDRE